MRRYKCIVTGCKSDNTVEDINFFCLPKKSALLDKWASTMHLSELLKDKPASTLLHMRVCTLHFETACFQTPLRKKLNRGVIPTILRATNDHSTFSKNFPQSKMSTLVLTALPVPSTNLPEFQVIPGPSRNQQFENCCTPPPAVSFSANSQQLFITEPLPPNTNKRCRDKRPYGILKKMGETRVRDLSPKKRKIYGELVKSRHIITTMKKRGAARHLNRLFNNMDLDSGDFFKNLKSKVNEMPAMMQIFLKSVVGNYAKKPLARRWNNDEKSFFVALLKSILRGYNHLAKFLPMPSQHTLNRSLANIDLRPGINNILFQYLSFNSNSKEPLDRYCLLMFDQVSLRPHLSYNKGTDQVDGLEEVVDERSYKLADHALVFMIRGLYKSWKQPLAFFFVQSTAKTYTLKSCIQQVVRAVHEQTKFVIVASVSDMGSSNRAAVKSLSEEYGRPYIYNVNGHEIIHVFDTPHLLKCMRNNFMTKNIVYNNGNKTEKWEHLKALYDTDGTTVDSKLTKLTKDHIAPEGKKKLKVSLAVQVFSRTIYAVLTMLTNSGSFAAQDTADFCLFMNNLFDSLNSTMISYRPLACRVKDNSEHHKFWAEAKHMMQDLSFVIGDKTVSSPPCVEFFLVTIRNMQELWSTLKNLGFSYVLTKSVNQDPLENLFAVIRGLCGQNDNPTC